MNNTIKNKLHLPIVVCCILFAHCTPYDEYKKYMPDGEIIYLQKADSVKTYPGKNRIQLEWMTTDPKVSYFKVLYEQNGIQKETSVAKKNINDTIRLIIPDLEEGVCRFRIVSYDDLGNTSIPVDVDELTYGALYEQALLNRLIKNYILDEESNNLTLEWYNSVDETEIGTELIYTDINDFTQIKFFSSSETFTILSNFNIDEPLNISTKYKPVPSSIDIFSASTEKIVLSKR